MFRIRAIRVNLDQGAMQREVGIMSTRAVNRGSITAMSRAKAFAPVDTSALRNSITRTQPRQTGRMFWSSMVYTDSEYAWYQERGTRAHGPRTAKAMRFKPKGSNKYIFATWVRGVPASNYMRRAMNSLRVTDFVT